MEQEQAKVAEEAPKGITKQERLDSLMGILADRRDVIEKFLPKVMTADKLFSLARIAITNNPALLQCSSLSIIQSLAVAAQLGLNPTGVMGEGHVLPYKNRRTQRLEATFIPGYRGLMQLAIRSKMVWQIESRLVREGEHFEMEFGTKPYIKHAPHTTIPEGCPVVGCYAIARGEHFEYFDYMDRAELDAIRARSRAKDSGPWVSDTNEMYRKTAVRRLCKYLPLSPEMSTALSMEDALDQRVTPPPVVELPPQLAPEPAPIPDIEEESQEGEFAEEGFVPPTPEEEQAALEGETKGQKLAAKIKKGRQGDLPI